MKKNLKRTKIALKILYVVSKVVDALSTWLQNRKLKLEQNENT